MSTSSSPEVATAAGAAKVPASPWSQPSRLLALAWGIVLLLAVVSRTWELGERAMSHDESQHTYYSHGFAVDGTYEHDPKLHGPLLFHLTAGAFLLLGDTDATARLSVALTGVVLVALMALFRRHLGECGALAAAVLGLTSPVLLFYSRYIRNDIYIAALLLVWVYALLRHLEERRSRWLLLLAGAAALSFCSKEVTFIHGAIVGSFTLSRALRSRGRPAGRAAGDLTVLMLSLALPFAAGAVHAGLGLPVMPVDDGATRAGILTVAALALLGAVLGFAWFGGRRPGSAAAGGPGVATWARCAALFWGLAVTLFSGLLTRPAEGTVSGFVGSLGYWLLQHDEARGSQPWFYYLLLALLYEPLLLVLGGVGAVWVLRWRRREPPVAAWPGRPDAEVAAPAARRDLLELAVWWALAATAGYAIAGEKMPWLLVHVVLPLVLLGGWALGRLVQQLATGDVTRPDAGRLLATGFFLPVLLAGWTGLRPFAGRDVAAVAETARWLLCAALSSGLLVAAARPMRRMGPGRVGKWLAAGATAIALLFTTRAALLASFVHFDLAVEPLVYAHATPDVKLVMREIELLSRRTAGELQLVVAHDAYASWPFAWYLRNYPNAFVVAESAAIAERRPAVVLIAGPTDGELWPAVARDFDRRVYRMIWWPLQEYGGPAAVVPRLSAQATWRDVRDLVLHRRYADRTLAEWPYRQEVRMYVRSELAGLGNELPFTLAGLPPAAAPVRSVPTVVLAGHDLVVQGVSPLRGPAVIVARPGGGWAIGETEGRRVLVVDGTGAVRLQLDERHGLGEIWGLAFTSGGDLAVADTWNGRVLLFDPAGRQIASRGAFGAAHGTDEPLWLYGPRALAVHAAGALLVADTGNRRLLRLLPADGLRPAGASGVHLGLAEPVGLAAAPDGSILVADSWNERIVRLGPDLELIAQWRVPGWLSRAAEHKPYLAVDGEGRVYVSDPAAGRLLLFSAEGALLAALELPTPIRPGSKPRPLGVAIDPVTGELLIADAGGDRVFVAAAPPLAGREGPQPAVSAAR